MVTDKLVYTRSTHARQIGTGVYKVFVHLNKTSPCKEFNTSKLKATIIFLNSKHMTLYVHIYFNNSRQTLEFEFQYQLSHCSLMMRKCYPVCLNVQCIAIVKLVSNSVSTLMVYQKQLAIPVFYSAGTHVNL